MKRFVAVMDADGLNLWKNAKNTAFMNENGFTQEDVKDVVRNIKYHQYNKGPEPDPDPARPHGEVWIFNTEWLGIAIYLKIKVVGTSGGYTSAECLSFHEPERGMGTPLKVDGRGRAAGSDGRKGKRGTPQR